MKNYTVKITRQAKEQFFNIKEYIFNISFSHEITQRMINLLKEKIAKLAYMPYRFELTNEEPWRSRGASHAC